MLQILTDSAADITLAEAARMKIGIIPLTITFPDGICPQETEADFVTFYQRLESSSALPTTSQPAPDTYLQYYEQAKENGDEVLVLTLSSGLSGTYQAACTAKTLCDYEGIYIVDTHQAILSQRMLVEEAIRLRDQGLPAAEIAKRMEALRDRVTVSGVVDTLVYLRKGGRIPASLAILGTTLKIKPVIALQDTKLQTIGKAMGRKAGIRMLYERFEKYPPDPAFPIFFAYSATPEAGQEFMEETLRKYDLAGYDIRLYPVGGIIGTHVGPNCIALCYTAREPITT